MGSESSASRQAIGVLRQAMAAFAADFDASLLLPADARSVVRDAAAVENMAAMVKAAAAARASEDGQWRREGAPSPAHALARESGSSVLAARQALETAEKMAELPALDAAARRGEVSPAQAAPIADAAAKDPKSEGRLLDKAKRASLGELREECDRTKAAAEPDDEARHEAIRKSRFLRRRRTADGAGELTYRSTLDEVAEIFAIAQGHAKAEFDRARLEGRRETEEAYLADGLLTAVRGGAGATGAGAGNGAAGDATGAGAASTSSPSDLLGAPDELNGRPARPESRSGDDPAGEDAASADEGAVENPDGESPAPAAGGGAVEPAPAGAGGVPAKTGRVRNPTPTKIVVRIDWDALVRGFPIEGETCEIAGVGTVPVSMVRAMMASGDAFLAAVVTKGVDVVNVAHLGRKPSAYQTTALEWTSPTCTTEGCNRVWRLETDHTEDWARTKITLLSWLENFCGHCHYLKTVHGWALVEGKGKRPLVPPDDPRHPRHSRHGPEPPPTLGDAA